MTKCMIVKELWWEEKDLHIINENDEHFVYKNAYYTKHEMTIEPDSVISVEKCSMTYHDLDGEYLKESNYSKL